MKTLKSNRRKTVKRARRLPVLPRIPLRSLITSLSVIVVVGGAFFGSKILFDNPIRMLILQGSFQRVPSIQIEAALGSNLNHGFLSADITEMRRQIERLDWIDKTEIRRIWPDTLKIELTEHRAVARWGKGGLLNIHGELFTENVRHTFPELPQLTGPDGREKEVADYYLSVRGPLAQVSLQMQRFSMDDRGAVRMFLEDGQEIRLGQNGVTERLDRFFTIVAPTLVSKFARVRYVDLRYINGFAVGWLPEVVAPQVAQTQAVTDSG